MAMESGYQAALESAAFLSREDRRFLEVTGKAPGEMLKGILSGTIPGPLTEEEGGPTVPGGASTGRGHYSAVLTPKGKMVTDLRILPQPPEGFLLELSAHGLPGLEAHLEKYLPPRLARTRDRSGELAMVSVVGPRARGAVAGILGGDGGLEEPAPEEGGFGAASAPGVAPTTEAPGPASAAFAVALHTHTPFGALLVLENGDLPVPALDLVVDGGAVEAVQAALEEAGAAPLGVQAWEVLRIEAGTPAFGVDMTEETIPVEAGIHDRAVDYQKGCYSGQEVIIRIRDRGKVNKRLRRIHLGDAPVPQGGAELFPPGEERSRGWITSACRSPRFGETVALGYVKRGLEPGQEVRLGSPEGPRGRLADAGS